MYTNGKYMLVVLRWAKSSSEGSCCCWRRGGGAGQRLFRRRRFHQNQMESEEEEEALGLPAVAKGQDELVGALLGPELLRLVAALDQPVVQLPRVRSCTSGRVTRPKTTTSLQVGEEEEEALLLPSLPQRLALLLTAHRARALPPSQPFLDAKTSHYSHVRLIPPKYRSGSSTRPS